MVNQINKVGIFISAFIAILLGIILLGVIADQVYLNTDATYTATEEAITLSNVTAVDLTNDWVTSITTVLAEYGTVNATLTSANYTVTYLNSDTVAKILLIDDNFDGNSSWITYGYQDNSYVRDASSRVIIALITIFFVLAVLATGIWAMNQMGLMEFMK